MDITTKILVKTILKIGLIYVFAGNLYAKCSKEDVDYYLEKGFTTEQVTAMCTKDILSTIDLENNKYKSFSEEYADETDEEYLKKMRIERQAFLKSAIAAQKIRIKGTIFSYESEICGRNAIKKSGSADGANIEGCAVMRTDIDLSNIEVSKKQKREKIFFGTKEIFVKGDISYKIVGGLNHLTPFEKKILEPILFAKLKKGEARIPVRKGLDFNYALENFIDIVNFHKDVLRTKYIGKGLGGKLNTDDLIMESQSNYIIEKEEKGIKFSNNTDESIDGTLVFDDLPLNENNTANNNNEIPESVFD